MNYFVIFVAHIQIGNVEQNSAGNKSTIREDHNSYEHIESVLVDRVSPTIHNHSSGICVPAPCRCDRHGCAHHGITRERC